MCCTKTLSVCTTFDHAAPKGFTCLPEAALTVTLKKSNKTVETLQRAESNAFCAIAELYMTDLCDLPEARTECQKAFEGATQTDPTNPQAWLAAANFYTVTADSQASRDAVQRCLDIWWTKLETFLAEEQAPRTTSAEVPDEPMRSAASDASGSVANAEETKLDLEELTSIPLSGLISLCRMMIELEMDERSIYMVHLGPYLMVGLLSTNHWVSCTAAPVLEWLFSLSRLVIDGRLCACVRSSHAALAIGWA
ncbi:hypothetical protein CRM22_000978 [Opisthorchis felineus]|uniref:Uncharacterized protein n=1 Tax=Opisthorchis felineus TaxID=147828 RepID=A0A4S2MCP2_OPIFE|nr:hypothetical protein CRM22_000978 [Opisthorchis felineus]